MQREPVSIKDLCFIVYDDQKVNMGKVIMTYHAYIDFLAILDFKGPTYVQAPVQALEIYMSHVMRKPSFCICENRRRSASR